MINKDMLLQIKELMERYHSDVNEIAHKMHLDPITVKHWIDTITDMLT